MPSVATRHGSVHVAERLLGHDVRALVAADARKPYHYAGVDPHLLTEHVMADLAAATERAERRRFVYLERDGSVVGFALLRELVWDSEVLGIPAGRIEHLLVSPAVEKASAVDAMLESVVGCAGAMGLRLLDLRVDAKDIKLAPVVARFGFYLVDTVITYVLPLEAYRDVTSRGDVAVRPIEARDVAPMLELASTAFADPMAIQPRFYNDPHIPSACAGRVYRRWLENLVRDAPVTGTLVATVADRAIGFVTCQRVRGPWEAAGRRIGRIPLNAVARDHRGRGAYGALVRGAVEWFREEGCATIVLGTSIDADPVRRAWERIGARLAVSFYTFHRVDE